MANYLYNGVELPELPEWDKTAYPYITGVLHSGFTAFLSRLRVTDKPSKNYVTDNNDSYMPEYPEGTNYIEYKLNTSTSSWYQSGSGQYESGGVPVESPNWTNHDLFYADGTLYLGATVPLPTIGKTWRYNGVELPALPEWDAQTYPYVLISRYSLGTPQIYAMSVRPHTYRDSYGDLYTGFDGETVSYLHWRYGSEQWRYTGVNEGSPRTQIDRDIPPTTQGYYVWANYDVLDEDGSVMHSASQPIPVGTFPIPEVYVPYVNTAKNIFDVQCGKSYRYIAVAENQNYISVHFLTDDFRLVTYDAETTIYTATGIAFVTYDKRTDQWSAEVVDNTTTPSEGSRYISHWVWSEVDVSWNGSVVFTNQEGWYYNSVKLPELPECDKSAYPYVVIQFYPGSTFGMSDDNKLFMIVTYDRKPYIVDGNKISIGTSALGVSCIMTDSQLLADFLGLTNVGSWTNYDESVHDPDGSLFEEIVWTNVDLLNEDGSVYLSASEPVHVTYVIDEGGDDDPDNPGGGGGGGSDDDEPAYDEISFKIGLALGLCGKGIPQDDLNVIGGE